MGSASITNAIEGNNTMSNGISITDDITSENTSAAITSNLTFDEQTYESLVTFPTTWTNTYQSDEKIDRKEPGPISKATYETFKVTVWFGIIPVSSFLGIIGNLFGLWFLLYVKLDRPFYLFLFMLILVDLLYLVIILLTDSIKIIEIYNKPLADYINCHASMNLRTVQSLSYSTCAHLITIMSFERLANIMLPFRFQRLKMRTVSILLIVLIVIINIILMVPAFLVRESKDIIDVKTNTTVCVSGPTKWAKQSGSFNKYYVVTMLVVARFIPGVATTIANIAIAIFLSRQRAQRAVLFANKAGRDLRGEQYEQLKITLTLIALSICLLMSLVPSAMSTILSSYYPSRYGRTGSHYFTLLFVKELGYLLRVVSAANDFFIYVVLSNTSRGILKKMLISKCCCCCAPKVDEGIPKSNDGDSQENRAVLKVTESVQNE